MEAHRSYERFERSNEVAAESRSRHATTAAFAVAVMAAFLAVSAFLANKAVKEVITGETHRADATARLESNLLKTDVIEGNADLLRVLGSGSDKEARAAVEARQRESRVQSELAPADARLHHEIDDDEHHVETYDDKHLAYELAEVGLEVGIVLASVSIIIRRRWLLGIGSAVGAAGVVALLVGFLV
ncbi:MAG TPA: DUF4337 family protein [Solirubrobacterales bacterium]|jgi:hypothetical protein